MSTSMVNKLFLCVLVAHPDSEFCSALFDGVSGRTCLVWAPDATKARECAGDNIDECSAEEFFMDDSGNSISVVELPLSEDAARAIEEDLSGFTYEPPAPTRTTVFDGVFKRTSGPNAIQFIELLKREIVKGIFNGVDAKDGVALMRKVAYTMAPYWGLLKGAMVSELTKGGMPEGIVAQLSADLDKVPYGNNAYIWEFVYVPEEGIGHFRLAAYKAV